MNILCIGDVVGKPGRLAVEGLLGDLKKEFNIDLTIVNAENAAGGSGITVKIAKRLFEIGCDVLTMGDHVWDQKEIEEYLNEEEYLIRPANFPTGAPGRGWCIKKTASGAKVGVVNLMGRVFMRYHLECPFRAADAIINEIRKETPNIIVDMHAEATSEKVAVGHYVDGRVSAVFGTHTHIQTADEKILPKGTAYITDLGMTGPYDSVIGQNKEHIIRRFLTSLPHKFQVAHDDVRLHGMVVAVDKTTGNASRIQRLQRPFWVEKSEAEKEEN
ncbi:MAG TPA: TIGR00282 family metallophosphoesterase [Candidatus Omnitrophota bacterium]|nr:TIGR00282 family metallophosphoesterase [Candidatus Omnitrophota bacterium]